MDLHRVGSWLQVGANVGILAGLILVGVQLRQSNAITGAELFSNNLESTVGRELALIGESPEKSMSRVLFEPDAASREDYFVADRIYSVVIRQLNRAIALSAAGFYGTAEGIDARGFANINYDMFACPYGLAWLDQLISRFAPDSEYLEYLTLLRELAARQSAAEVIGDRTERAKVLVEQLQSSRR